MMSSSMIPPLVDVIDMSPTAPTPIDLYSIGGPFASVLSRYDRQLWQGSHRLRWTIWRADHLESSPVTLVSPISV